MQAAIGLAQLEKFPAFVRARKKNWAFLRKALNKYSDRLILPEPAKNSEPSWFGFLITVRDDAGFTRNQIVDYLEKHKIQTRMRGNAVFQNTCTANIYMPCGTTVCPAVSY